MEREELYILRTKFGWDFPFTLNENTQMFFEGLWDGIPAEDSFPIYDPDIKGLLRWFADSVDNARYYGAWNLDDDHWSFGFKNGSYRYVGDGEPVDSIRKNVFAEKNLSWVVWQNSAETRFWFRDWDALIELNNVWGWLDVDLYEDWV